MSQTQTTKIYSEPPIKINRTLYGVLLATLASVFWGSMGVCVQYIFENTNTQPQALSSLRLLLSGTVLVILNLFLSRRPLLAVLSSLKGTAGIALSGLELLGAHLTFFIAIYYSNAGTAAIFLATTPLLAGIYLFLRGKKRFTAKEGLCCALAFFGVLLIVSKGDFSTFQFNWMAVFWGMISAVFASIYSIQPKPLIDRWGVVPVASWGMMAAGIAGLFLANPIVTAEGLDAKAWLALSYIVLAGTVAAFWLYLACLKYIYPVTAGLVVCLEPTSAYVFGIMFMNLKLGWIECVGIAMVISQVFILSIRSKERS